MASHNPRGSGRPVEAVKIFAQSGSGTNANVSQLENSMFLSKPTDALRALKLNDDTDQPLRPAYGTQGRHITLFANYFQLVAKAPALLHCYSVSILSESEARKPKGKKLSQIVRLLIKEQFKGRLVVSDYTGTMISNSKLPWEQKQFSVQYRTEDGEKDSKLAPYKFLVQFSKTLDSQELLASLSSKRFDVPENPLKIEILQALNIILGHGFKGESSIVAHQNKYLPLVGGYAERFVLGSGVDMFRGYHLSVRGTTGRLLLNTQVKHMAMYRPQNLASLFAQLNVVKGANTVTLRNAERVIKGLKVKLNHFKPHRNKTILGFAAESDGKGLEHPPKIPNYGASADQVQFWVKDTGYTTVAAYFHASHNKKKSMLPVVNTGSHADPKYAIAEVCDIPAGVAFTSRLSPEQTKVMIDHAVRKPFENAVSLTTNGFGLIQAHSLENFKSFGWETSNSLIQVPGRVLPGPNVLYADKKPIPLLNGSWNMKNLKFVNGKTLPSWSVLWITIKGSREYGTFATQQKLEDHIRDNFRPTLAKYGSANAAFLGTRQLELVSEGDCVVAVPNMLKRAAEATGGPKLLLIVLPTISTTIYNAVKKAGDITYGIHTVCVINKKFNQQNNEMYNANVALKINLKLGGRNHSVRDQDLAFIAEGKTMLVGIDVTHPAAGEDKAPSVSSIVASIDKHCGQWPAHIHIQPPRQEMVQVLKPMLQNRLRYWSKLNGSLPLEILVYRDGVGDGQYNLVRTTELAKMREACKELYSAESTKKGIPRITIVIVGKRHNTRFYPTKMEDSNKGNPKNGTIVDRGVTEARVWDFYLQAHTALLGTAKPAHYVVVHDEIFHYRAQLSKPALSDRRTVGQRAADSLETITHNLCYLYGRATKAVSVCPPAYYADIACERARRWLSRLYTDYGLVSDQVGAAQAAEVKVHPNLENSMFYV